MFGFSLEQEILFINILSLVVSAFDWSFFKWEHLKEISNFFVSQSDELDVGKIDWLKTSLSWIDSARFVIACISFFAYVANMYTVVTRNRHLLVLWMVLSSLKDIVLEVVVFVITILLWRAKKSFSTSLLGFIAEKIIRAVLTIYMWCKIVKWYMQLRKEAKFRRFTIIARRSIASVANVPGRIGRSLDDEYLDIAIARRGTYVSLLNVGRLSEESSSRTKSLTLLTDNMNGANGANNYNFDVNDLSVAEKSMRMLNVTAEDIMDACARIQERSYWGEQDAKIPGVIEEKVRQFPPEKNEEEMIDATRNKQAMEDNLEKTADRTSLKKEDVMKYFPVKKEEEKDNEKIIPVDDKKQIVIRNPKNISLKSENITFDTVDPVKSTEFHDIYVTPKKKRKEKKGGVTKIIQCPSLQSINTRNMEAKPCASLVKKLEAKLCSIPVNQQEKRIVRIDRRKYSHQVNTQVTTISSSASKKECYEISKISCRCHRALGNSSKNRKHMQSTGIDDENVEYDINGKEFKSFRPIVNMQRSRIDKSAFKYSEAYRLKKQIQKWEECREEKSWGSKSLAETTRSSGYAKNVIDTSDKLSVMNCRKNIQTETYDESMMSDSLSERHRLKYDQKRRGSINLRSVYNIGSFKEKNYAEAHQMKKALETCNNFMENTKETKVRKRHDLLLANRKLSIEQREAIELKALRAYNELTLSEDKRELEMKKEHDLSWNCEQLTKESEVSEMKVLKTYNDLTSPEDKKEMERTKEHNLSPSSQQSVDERSILRVRNELTRSGSEREVRTRRKRDSSRDETPSECEDVETPASVSNRVSVGSYENITIPTHRNINSNFGPNDRYARQAHMSLNLREITRNIEWTIHPRGIILTNKNLYGQFLENGRFHESQQRDIIDDNTASTLHSAFFFKPEIITRVFRRAHNQTRFDEFFSTFPTFLRQDFDTEFVCQMNNEMVARHRSSPFDCDLERMMENNRSNFGEHFNADNHGITDDHGHDLCVIVIDQEQVSSESQTATEGLTTIETQENARSSIESIRMTNILVFNENHNRVDNATNDNLPVRLITSILRNFEMSEESIRDVASPIEECEDVSNVNVCNNSQSRELNVDAININEGNNNEYDRTSSHKNAEVDDTIHKIEQTLNSNDNCLDNINVTSHASFLEKLDSKDKQCLNTIDIYSENKCENNLSLKSTDNKTTPQLFDDNNNNNKQFDTLDNTTEKSTFNHVFKNSSKLSFPGPSSLIKSNNCHALKSCDEELQKLIQLSDSAATLNEQKKESNLKVTRTHANYTVSQLHDTIPQCRSVEISKLENMIQGARSQNENRDEEANKFLAEKCFKMHSDDKLEQDDSFYFMYDRNNDPGTPVSLDDGSLMEEFLSDPEPLNSSYF